MSLSIPTIVDTIALPTGVRLPYVEQGDRAGVPVLLLHGYSDSWRSYEHVLPHLPGDLRAIAVTHRGHGDADRPASGYAPDDFAADVVALLDALAIERAVIVGHSMSAWIAERVAACHSDRVLGVVLAGAIGPARHNAAVAKLVAAVDELRDPVDREFAYEFQLSTLARPLPDGQLDTFIAESLKLPARVWRAIKDGWPSFDVQRELAAIEAPALVVWGDRDTVGTRAEQDAIVRALERGRLLVYEGTGHALFWEQPARFAADVTAFAREVAG